MKILYFIPRYDRSLMGNRIHAEIIEAWRTHGADAEVVTLTAGLRHPVSETQDGILVHRLPVSSGPALKLANRTLDLIFHYPYLAGALLHYRRFLRTRRYDSVHIETSFPLGMIAALTPRSLQPPLAITLPGADIMSEPQYDYGYGRFAAVRALLPIIFKRADVLRADSPQIRSLAVRLGAAPERIVAIPYNITVDSYPPPGADLAQFRIASRAQIVQQHNLDRTRPLIVSLNRLHPFKGFIHLIEATALLYQNGLRPYVIIVGPNRKTPRFGDYGAYLRQRTNELGIADAIIFTGGVEHAMALTYLAAADIAVIGSVAESFSRVAIEAAAAGTPVVITKTTGASDYIAEHRCGMVVEPKSAEALAHGAMQLLRDEQLRRELGERGPLMAGHFSSAAIAQALLSLYQERLPIRR